MAVFTKASYEPLAQMMLEERREQIKGFNGLGAKAIEALKHESPLPRGYSVQLFDERGQE